VAHIYKEDNCNAESSAPNMSLGSLSPVFLFIYAGVCMCLSAENQKRAKYMDDKIEKKKYAFTVFESCHRGRPG